VIESAPLQEGRNMSMLLGPSKEVDKLADATAVEDDAAPAESDAAPAEDDAAPTEDDAAEGSSPEPDAPAES
jgi:translation initiation factor IF-3